MQMVGQRDTASLKYENVQLAKSTPTPKSSLLLTNSPTEWYAYSRSRTEKGMRTCHDYFMKLSYHTYRKLPWAYVQYRNI